MDDNLARLERIYPNGKYVLIPKYDPSKWVDREYDSAFDTKAAINRWKTKPLSYADAQQAVDEGFRVGWIVPKGYVIVDVDNKDCSTSQERIEKLLNKFECKYSYNYTSKGIHCLFIDPTGTIKSDSVTKCSINIAIDTRANDTGYIVLPCNDPHREWGEWNDFVEEIPYFLIPALKDNTPTFIGMTEGDGRNNALFKWRSKLEMTHKFTTDQIEKSIRIINENLFDTAMPNAELYKTVLRQKDVKPEKISAVDKENIFNKLADDIIAKRDIVSYFENFYSFNGTYYKPISDLDLERLIHFELSSNLSQSARKEIIQFLKVKTQIPVEEFDKDWHKIACKNGILNLVTGEIEIPTKSDINTIYIPYEYDPDPPPSPRIMEFMKELCGGDLIKINFLYQIAGYCLLKKNLFEKFFIFKGEGGTGKSTYMNLLHKMVGGDRNCSHVGLENFDNDYYLSSTVSKLLNIDDDAVDGKTLNCTGRFKSIISGNIIAVRQIYHEVISFIPYITCVFSCNKLPRILDKTSGLYRRMVLIELNNKIEKPDPLFMNKITDEDIRYFLFKAVEGIKEAIEEGKFKITQSENALLQMFKRRQSPLNEWLYEMDVTLGDIVDKQSMPLYSQFKVWCEDNGYNKILSSYSFKEDICALYDVELDLLKVNKGVKQVFVRRGEYDENWRPF